MDTKLALEIKILDVNDHAPTFQMSVYEVTVDESHDQGNPYTSLLHYFIYETKHKTDHSVITHPHVIAVHNAVIFLFITLK